MPSLCEDLVDDVVCDPADVGRIWQALVPPGGVTELRCLETHRKTVSGYYDNVSALVRDATKWSGKASGIYFILNEVKPELLARAANRARDYATSTTTDRDIQRRRVFMIDCDPVRASGISSSASEHQAALRRAAEIREALRDVGWPDPIYADSGNGSHLLYGIDLPNDKESQTLLERCLKVLSLRFGDAVVAVDESTHNAARLCKLYGTLAQKGDSTPDRPHRLSRILELPEQLEVVSLEQLQALAAQLPSEAVGKDKGRSVGFGSGFDADEWIARNNVPVVSQGEWNGGRKWILNPCPWNPEHRNRSAFIVRFPSGAMHAGCHHNGCANYGWYALRDHYEPGWRDRNPHPAASMQARASNLAVRPLNTEANRPGSNEESDAPRARPWPDPLAPEAYHGLAGKIVRAIEPHTESDPVAVLVQFLIAFGNAAGRRAFFRVEADRHYTNNFVALVGNTSKGRKGTSWGHVRSLIREAEPTWAKERILSGLASGEGMIWAVRDPIEKQQPIKEKGRVVDYETVIDDPGVEDKRLLIVESELASTLRVLSREGNTLSALVRCAWDIGDLQSLTKNSPARATGAHISIIGHITRDELLRYLENTEAANGFANRFLWVCVRRSKSLPDGGEFHQASLQTLVMELREALAFAAGVDEVTRTPDTRAVWHAVYPELSAARPGMLGAITARAEPHVLRLATLYALLDRSRIIQGEHLGAALAVWEYAEASARFIFGDSLGDPIADEILQALRRSTAGLTRTDISHHLGRNVPASQIRRSLEVLLESGLVEREAVPTEGRPAELWKRI